MVRMSDERGFARGPRPRDAAALRWRGRLAWVSLAALLAGALGPIGSAAAEDLPPLRKGQWSFERTIEGGPGGPRKVSSRKCVAPTEDMKRQNAMLAKAGCTFSPVTRSGATYTFTSDCKVQGVSAQSKSVLTVESDSAYRLTVESRQDGHTTHEVMVARRVGEC